MIQHATKEMLPQLEALWSECFGDSVDYSSFFFSHKLIGDEVFQNQYVYMVGEQTVSMLSVLPALISNKRGKKRFWYIYGVATGERYRGRGYAGQLLEHVLNMAREQDIAVGLVPASESLFQYYAKLGFETYFFKRKVELNLEKEESLNVKHLKVERITPVKYREYRNLSFQTEDTIIWDDAAVEYALLENEKIGGEAYQVTADGKSYFALCYVEKDELILRETNLPDSQLKNACGVLGRDHQCRKASISVPVGKSQAGEIAKHGMIYNYEGVAKTGYLGLALD